MSTLKLVLSDPVDGAGGARWPWLVTLLLVAAATLATLRGADEARRPIAARVVAGGALDRSLARGSNDPTVRATLVELRRRVGRQPLDTATRVAYASLLLGLSRSVEETAAAAFHARLSAELSPVTVPVVRAAAVILARTGDTDAAVERVRRMFEYDPGSAADLLLTLSPVLERSAVERCIADAPEAWIAWLARLREAGRDVEANDWLDGAYARWPEHPETATRMAARCVRQEDWPALIAMFAPPRTLRERAEEARLFAYRALAHSIEGDRRAAVDDIELALRLGREEPTVRITAGDARAALGQFDEARRLWNEALFLLARQDAPETRLRLLVRLAGLEDEHGQPAAALRLWRSVLELDPEHLRARRRVEDLTGFSP